MGWSAGLAGAAGAASAILVSCNDTIVSDCQQHLIPTTGRRTQSCTRGCTGAAMHENRLAHLSVQQLQVLCANSDETLHVGLSLLELQAERSVLWGLASLLAPHTPPPRLAAHFPRRQHHAG